MDWDVTLNRYYATNCWVPWLERCDFLVSGWAAHLWMAMKALRRDRLAWVKQNYVRDDTLTAANATLVAAQNRIALAHAWSGGEIASADGMRFVPTLSDEPTPVAEPGMPFSLVFRCEPGREDVLLKALRDFKSGARVSSGIASMTDVVYGLNDDAIQALAHYMATRP